MSGAKPATSRCYSIQVLISDCTQFNQFLKHRIRNYKGAFTRDIHRGLSQHAVLRSFVEGEQKSVNSPESELLIPMVVIEELKRADPRRHTESSHDQPRN